MIDLLCSDSLVREDNVLVMKIHWSWPEGMPKLYIFWNRPPRLGSLKAILKQAEVSAHQ